MQFYRLDPTPGALSGLVLSIIVLSLSLLSVTPYCRGSDEPELPPEEIIAKLQQGGLVVYFRHAATNHSEEDQHPVDLDRCETQRNLTQRGRNQSIEIGKAFKRLAIPVSKVLTSPFCRCRETARLAFGESTTDPNLYFSVDLTKPQRDAQAQGLRSMISLIPNSGNRIIVAHTGNLREATHLWPKPEGVAYVFQPLGDGNYRVLGSIPPDRWKDL